MYKPKHTSVRELNSDRIILTVFMKSGDNLTDPLTKVLPRDMIDI